MNEEMLKLAVKRIEANPESWNQSAWAKDDKHGPCGVWNTGSLYDSLPYRANFIYDENECGTSFCLAGHVLVMNGYQLTGSVFNIIDPDGNEVYGKHLQDKAMELLDIDEDVADVIFDATFGNGDLEQFKQHLTKATGVEFD